MPANLISVVLNWFATHLVVFSLLGFLFAGIRIFGLIEAPGSVPTGDLKTPPASAKSRPGAGVPPVVDPPARMQSGRGSAEVGPEKAGDGGREAGLGKSERPEPRLIGGSLPLHGQADGSRSTAHSMPDGDLGGFRPPGETEKQDPVGMTRDDYLQRARRAFWNGEFETAEAAYMVLISRFPADADAFGELGNLYQSMGKPDRAMDAYFEAAVRLKAAGETEKLKEINDVLMREGDERVKQLSR